MRFGIFGRGQFGSALRDLAGAELVWHEGGRARPQEAVDVALVTSLGEDVEGLVAWALERRTDLLIGSTGWSLPDLHGRVGERIGVMTAPNTSLLVALVERLTFLLGRFAALDPERDLYLSERYGPTKADAPSGTVKLLAEVLLQACPRKREWAFGGPLRPDQLSVSAIRAGHVYSSLTVGLDAPGEHLELHQVGRSPQPYAQGALAAARWLHGRKGVFQMSDYAASLLGPMLREAAER